MSIIKKCLRQLLPNPLDQIIAKASSKPNPSFLLVWNRGLGDIALGLYAIVYRIRQAIPNAKITFLTRKDLKEGFKLLGNVEVIISSLLKRGAPFSLKEIAINAGIALSEFDVIIEHPDPSYWVKWQLGVLQPKLVWQHSWENLPSSLHHIDKTRCIGIHVHSETSYGYEKNWSYEKWNALFDHLEKKNYTCLLFGKKAPVLYSQKNIIDLRGETSLLDLLTILKTKCEYFIGPDSGILSLLYFLDDSFKINAISLWADSNQGVLKQNVASPNPLFTHYPLIAKNGDLSCLSVEEVLSSL